MAYQPRVAAKSYTSGYVEYRLSLCKTEEDKLAQAEHLLTLMQEQLKHKQKRKKDIDDTQYSINVLTGILGGTAS